VTYTTIKHVWMVVVEITKTSVKILRLLETVVDYK